VKIWIKSKTQESGFILVGLMCVWDNVKDINILFEVCRGNLWLICTCNECIIFYESIPSESYLQSATTPIILSVVVQVPLIIHFKQYFFFSKEKPVAIQPTLFPQTRDATKLFHPCLLPFLVISFFIQTLLNNQILL